ncbi:hypothetical protein VTL71DRAFT_2633 [Oculimacula yallundae]|uniref:Uncharacterized protein n=1 Tax=Oculimacula yallundae TaxID=86028 RepID=A0ABR4C9E1_9HELO
MGSRNHFCLFRPSRHDIAQYDTPFLFLSPFIPDIVFGTTTDDHLWPLVKSIRMHSSSSSSASSQRFDISLLYHILLDGWIALRLLDSPHYLQIFLCLIRMSDSESGGNEETKAIQDGCIRLPFCNLGG